MPVSARENDDEIDGARAHGRHQPAENEGLLIAELELSSEDELFTAPPWILDEVSHDPRYFNASLVWSPYRTWRP